MLPHDLALVPRPPFPGAHHPARDLALYPLHAELPRLEELLAECGLELSYETIRRWVLNFAPLLARRLRQRRPRPGDYWHLDESAPRTHDQQRECEAA